MRDDPTQLATRLLHVGREIDRIARRLRELGYQFDRPDEVLPGPELGTGAAIERIELEAGALPLALKLFWRHIGSVDFSGHHPDWKGCDYPDPLIVYPARAAVMELDEFLTDIEERTRCDAPYVVPIAPDALHKANVSGGMWYNLSVPAVSDDPPLNDEPHATTFIGYLEIAVRWGGFPGLEQWPTHMWPLQRILSGDL